ncbi:MAG: hypothetical protein E6G39_13085 [Actinobacteria bacterium]|nr:MAG: hypothetical protein E6G39_13085 [Actinomycetota bacterium]
MDSLVVIFLLITVPAGIGIILRGRAANSKLISGTREPIAIVLLLIGAPLFGVGWLVGVVLLWSSPVWRLGDKLLGTLVWPFGLPMGALFATFGVADIFEGTDLTVVTLALYVTLAAFFVLAPIYTAIHLSRRYVSVKVQQRAVSTRTANAPN